MANKTPRHPALAVVAAAVTAAKPPAGWAVEEYAGNPQKFFDFLEKTPEAAIVKVLNMPYNSDLQWLFPSGWKWGWTYGGNVKGKVPPYPAKLAKALTKSNEAENLTDFFNFFYRDRNYSDDALKVFAEAAISEVTKPAFFEMYGEIMDRHAPQGFLQALRDPKGKALMKKIFMAIPAKVRDDLAWEPDGSSSEWYDVFTNLGIPFTE